MSIIIAGQIFSLNPDDIQKYAPEALKLYLQKDYKSSLDLSKTQKIIISKIYRNLNVLCKLTKKQLKQLFKQSKQYLAYQDVLSELFFGKQINNYILINKEEANVKIDTPLLKKQIPLKSCTNAHLYYQPKKCISIDYRIEFTISNINKKKVMKPLVLIVYCLEDLTEIKVYYSVQQFSILRYEAAESMKNVYGIQLRTMF